LNEDQFLGTHALSYENGNYFGVIVTLLALRRSAFVGKTDLYIPFYQNVGYNHPREILGVIWYFVRILNRETKFIGYVGRWCIDLY
tara:strand:- start:1283 stop:1540 length:258 start_codon:yes stop_codon:yes gene_type:complete